MKTIINKVTLWLKARLIKLCLWGLAKLTGKPMAEPSDPYEILMILSRISDSGIAQDYDAVCRRLIGDLITCMDHTSSCPRSDEDLWEKIYEAIEAIYEELVIVEYFTPPDFETMRDLETVRKLSTEELFSHWDNLRCICLILRDYWSTIEDKACAIDFLECVVELLSMLPADTAHEYELPYN